VRRFLIACAAVALTAVGCASPTKAGTFPAPPDFATRDDCRRVAVRVIGPESPIDVQKPPTGALEGAGQGALQGAGVGLEFAVASAQGMSNGGVYAGMVWVVVNAVVFPVCVVGGTVYGTFASMSAEELESRLSVLRTALDGAGPALGLDEALAAALHRDGVETTSAADAAPTLSVRVLRRGLLGPPGFDPQTSVFVEVVAELRDAAGVPRYRATVAGVGTRRAFTEWTDKPDLVSAEIPVLVRHLAERVADEVFLIDAETLQ
jgi:hypothetical protein